MSDWYCEHGYFEGRECPDCDVPSYLPAVLPLVKERKRMPAKKNPAREALTAAVNRAIAEGAPEYVAKPAPTYEEGFEYGRKCAQTMSPERRADNARMVRESEYFQPHSITRQYWRGFVSAMETSI